MSAVRRNHNGGRADAATEPLTEWMWTIEDTIEERVNDALRLWVEGLEDSLTRGGPKQSE